VARVAVVMPTFAHAAFVARALDSLQAQSFRDWEAVVVDDASPDDTADIVARFVAADPRVRLERLPENRGLGAALNVGLDLTAAPLVAYLPTDDVWYADHLESLVALLDARPDAPLAYAGLRHHYNRHALEPLDGDGLQLVQVAHRRSGDRWIERPELVTDDLIVMLFDRLRRRGPFVASGSVTCEWVDHPGQLHKLLREPVGGVNAYRQRFEVRHPLRFHTTTGDRIDEWARYARFREGPRPEPSVDGLRILLVGELAYNADRILALEERGHQLFGLWMPDPYWYNTVGPLPFGHVVDATSRDPAEAIRETRPDVVYALLNWQAVPWAAHVLRENPGVPFVWHFKEGPFISLEKGDWADLVELTTRADGVIHTSAEMRDWFATVVHGAAEPDRTLVLDGDLPKADWFEGSFAPRLSAVDGELHTVVPGRPIGLHPETVAALASQRVHVHFYGDFTHGQWRAWIDRAAALAPGRLHLHPTVDQTGWVRELSRYDAGWLHVFESRNRGDIRRADWDDLNLPARMATLAAAGLPMLQRANPGAIVATQSLARALGTSIFFDAVGEIGERLRDEDEVEGVRAAVLAARRQFSFDAHADRLIDFLRSTMARPRSGRGAAASGRAAARSYHRADGVARIRPDVRPAGR
jgi:glycosyltransferase involved in cell wall biosynthesis